MKNKIFLLLLTLVLSSFGLHKFYVAMYQVSYNKPQKRIEITTRIFADDISVAIQNEFHQKIDFTKNNSPQEIEFLKKYFSSHLKFSVNNRTKNLIFISKEIEDNTLICYLKINDATKISALKVENTVLTDVFTEQQNIVQSNINNDKKTLLLSAENYKGLLK